MRPCPARPGALLAAGLAAWLAGVGSTPAAAERVAVRAHDHGEFGRLAFEWPAPIEVESRPGPDELTLRFARPFEGDLRAAADRLRAYLREAARGPAADEVVLRLRPGTRSNLFTIEDRIVAVDLVRGDPEPPAVRVRTGRHDDFVRIVFDLPFAAGYDVEREDERVTVRFDRPARIDAAAIAGTLAPLVADARTGGDARASWITIRVPPSAGLRHFALAGNRVVVDVSAPPAPVAQTAEPHAQLIEPPAPVAAPSVRAPAGPPALAVSFEAVDGGAELRFDWALPVAAAVFVRAGHLWTVFAAEPADQAGAVPSVAAPAADVLGPSEVVTAESGLALRFPLRRPVEPTVARDGGLWRVALRDAASPPRPLEPRRLADPPRLFFPGAGAVIELTDPELGDRLHVLPLLESGRGHPQTRRLVELKLLATAQGIVWQPLADGLLARPVQGGVELGTPHGLHLTLLFDHGRTGRAGANDADLVAAGAAAEVTAASNGPVAAVVEPTGPDPPLDLSAVAFDPEESELAHQRALLQRVLSTPLDRRDAARLDLARFLLTRTRAAEALAVLGAVAPAPDPGTEAAAAALAGAARLLMGWLDEAAAALNVPALHDDEEVALWRAMLAAAETDWRRAARELERSGRTLASYPAPLRARLGATAALIALEVGRLEVAHAVLDGLRELDLSPHEQARLRFTEGLVLARDGPLTAAERTWRELAATAPSETRQKAVYTLTAQLLETGRIGPEEALVRLEAARPFWRGHPQEVTMLDGLARVYAERRDHQRALAAWKEAITRHPAAPEAGAIAEAMSRLFVTALSTDGDGAPSPLEALGLHRDYPELMPSGDVGDRLTRRLAERLAGMDLIEDAAALLERQIRHRLRGVSKAEAGAYLGELRLRQPEPAAALDALRASATAAALPAELRRKRRLVAARALAAWGRSDEALEALEGDRDREARLLRVALHFDRREWPRVVGVADGLLRERPDPDAPLDREERELVVRLALAHAQMDDRAGLRALGARFGEAMAGSPEHPAFAVATGGDLGAGHPGTVLAGSAEQIDAVRSLLDRGLGG